MKAEVDINHILLEAHEKSFQMAREKAIETGTPLIFAKYGKIIEVYPSKDKNVAQ